MIRIVFKLVLCFTFLSGYAQYDWDGSYEQIKRLQGEGVDTIVSYGEGGVMYGSLETSKQLGELVVERFTFILYKNKGKTFIVRCMIYADSSGIMGKEAISKPIMIDAGLILKWAADNFNKINVQPVCPYFIQHKLDSVNTVYEYYGPDHPGTVNIHIYIGKEQLGQSFALNDCEYKCFNDAPENLNYSYNIKTSTYKLYLMLKTVTDSIKSDLAFNPGSFKQTKCLP